SMVPADAWVRVEAEGAPGAELLTGLPGGAVCEYGPAAHGGGSAPADPAGRVVRLTVGATHSDALLHTLLTADPPWHIRTVTTVGDTHEPAEAPQDRTEAPQEAVQAVQAPHDRTEAPCGSVGAAHECVEAPQELTEALDEAAEVPRGLTGVPCESAGLARGSVGAAHECVEAPQELTEALHAAAEASRDLTEAPCGPAEFPREAAEAPDERTEARQEPNKAPQEATEAFRGSAEAPKEKA
ncbi:hypothetical protein L4B83_02740, partial [Streptomyces sp. PSAA01]|nr:hypothetical protein [Streptomyces sp. PSAA01]